MTIHIDWTVDLDSSIYLGLGFSESECPGLFPFEEFLGHLVGLCVLGVRIELIMEIFFCTLLASVQIDDRRLFLDVES